VKSRTDRILLALIVVLAAALVWIVYPTLEQRVIAAGERAPDFRITTDRGKAVSASDFGGKLLVLNFWATWCATCIYEIPSLDAMQKQLGPEGVVVVAVSVDTNEQQYKRFLQRFKVGFDTMRDPEYDLPTRFGTFQFPETYIIDRSGKVVEKVISDKNWMDPQFLSHIRTLL
jgi:peroxiredoxin